MSLQDNIANGNGKLTNSNFVRTGTALYSVSTLLFDVPEHTSLYMAYNWFMSYPGTYMAQWNLDK